MFSPRKIIVRKLSFHSEGIREKKINLYKMDVLKIHYTLKINVFMPFKNFFLVLNKCNYMHCIYDLHVATCKI